MTAWKTSLGFKHYHPMKNAFYLILALAAFALAIAASNGKLGGISDAEAFRRASLTQP